MSQASYNVPTGGSYSMVTFAGLMNAAYNALGSNNSGSSAPANGPGAAPQEGQFWFNITNVNFPILHVYDGVFWNRMGVLDVANSNWLPKMGGGVQTVASATTTDIGAGRQTFVTITGTAQITSFGSSAAVGEERKLQFSSVLAITYNAGAIVTPGLVNIVTMPGDSCTAIYQGSGIWIIFGYTRGLAPGFALPTGAVFWMPSKNLAVAGAVICAAGTIGSPSSGAGTLANLMAFDLFTYLWTFLPNSVCPVSGGRGSGALADWAANKTIQLPDLRGMTLAGLDDMNNSAAGRLTSLTMTPDGVTAMASGGGQVSTIAVANLPAHNHTGSGNVSDPGHTHTGSTASPSVWSNGTNAGAHTADNGVAGTFNINSNTTGITVPSLNINNTGSGTALNVMQPTSLGTYYICL